MAFSKRSSRFFFASMLSVYAAIASAGSNIAVVGSQDGRAEVFVAHAGPQGGVFHRYQTSPGGPTATWSGWRQIAAAPTGPQSIVAGRDGGGRLTVGWLSGGSIWIASAAAPGAGLGPPRKLDTSALRKLELVTNQDGRLEFLALNDTDNAWSVAQSAPGSWDTLNVHYLGGVNYKHIAATSYQEGRLATAVLDGGGRAFWRAQKAPNSGWTPGWRVLKGISLRSVGAAANADGRLEVAAVGGEGALWHTYEVPGGGWHDWRLMTLGPFEAISDLLQNQDGRLEAFTRSASRTARHIWQKEPNGNWQAAAEPMAFGAPTDDLAVTLLADGRLVAVSTDVNSCTATAMAQEVPNGRFILLQSLGRACPAAPPPPPLAKVNWLTATPDYLPAGSSTLLEWSLGANATCNPFNVVLLRKVYGKPDQMIPVTGPQTTTVVIAETTTFRLTASCPGTNISDFKEVLVTQSPGPSIPQALVAFLDGPFTEPDNPKKNIPFKASVLVGNVGNKASEQLTVKFFVDNNEISESTLPPLTAGQQHLIESDVPALPGFSYDLQWVIVETGASHFGGITLED